MASDSCSCLCATFEELSYISIITRNQNENAMKMQGTSPTYHLTHYPASNSLLLFPATLLHLARILTYRCSNSE